MKKYVITLSKQFMKGHQKAGESTYFKEQLLNTLFDNAGISACDCCEYKTRNCDLCGHKASNFRKKLHTIRGNYELWKKRIDEVQKGNAVLSIRQWSDKQYRSKQEVICELSAKDGVGIQKLLSMDDICAYYVKSDKIRNVLGEDLETVANNDGLSIDEFKCWFKNKLPTPNSPMAIIHFTKFRY